MMNATNSYDPFKYLGNSSRSIHSIISEAIKKIGTMGYTSSDFMIPANGEFYSHRGQGVVFQSHTEYFKKDRESRLVYKKYLMNRNYTRYNRKTVKATKYPVRMCGWKGKR